MTDRNENEGPADPGRRRLMAGAPVAGVAALAAGRAAAAGEESQGDPDDPRDAVYRETDHVRAYYARARG